MLQPHRFQENIPVSCQGDGACRNCWHRHPACRAQLSQPRRSVGCEADGECREEEELPEGPVQSSWCQELCRVPANVNLGVMVDASLSTSHPSILGIK